MGKRFGAWMSHGDQVTKAPPGFEVLAYSKNTPVAAMADSASKLYGLQFHPEVIHTPQGQLILSNFLFRICRFSGDWTMENFVENSVLEIEEKVGSSGRAVCGLSGGVDSSVAAMLVHRAIGSRLTCIFVDHGLLRKGEKEQVLSTFQGKFNMQIIAVDAAEEFLNLLKGVTDPEEKRKVIGNHFIRVFEREAEKLGDIDFLVQGTLYPDVIESGTATAAVIKSHHNVGGLPDDMQLSLIEPLKYLFKDEVRKVGEEPGLPEEIVWRHPFPGPGLAVRILGEVTPEKLSILREADNIIVEEIKKAGLYRKIWQVFAVLPNILSVGVQGDRRTYAHTVVLRAVTSEDGMTADWYPLPYEVLGAISSRLVNEIPQVNRFVYDLTSKPPSTIEWE
jgi:GMP synthase (glutamine-hydrolysing)